jgi:6-phosphogluconate dehydrogenase
MFVIMMGVSGSGKTTIGQAVAGRLGCPFYDGDNFHPAANVAKMAAGIPLTDEDRAGWLDALANLIRRGLERGEQGVIACSALKERYRDILRIDPNLVKFVYLKGSYEVILARMETREAHYMKPAMLQSQFKTLEEPEGVLVEDITQLPDVIVQNIMEHLMEKKYALGILGLGVMGRSLAQNFERNGYPVIGYDVAPRLPDDFTIKVTDSLQELVQALELPRTILLMVPAGVPVDTAINSLTPYLQAGDVIIDGGNSFFEDTEQRVNNLQAKGIHFVGMGVSGGESGALWGPSLMPGGAEAAWERLRPMLEAIAAKAEDGMPCVAWMGRGGAGHYIKMVHNGIEYGDMQLIAEIYDLLHRGAEISNKNLSDIFARWNHGDLQSYLIEITTHILARIDEETCQPLVDLILDEAAQKGTGKWTSQHSFDAGAAIPTINAAVESRLLSSLKSERVVAAKLLGSASLFSGNKSHLINAAEQTLYASKITSYAQGLSLLKVASIEYDWGLNFANIVRVWRAGCIIRAGLLNDIASAFTRNPDLPNLLIDEVFKDTVLRHQAAWREVVQVGIGLGIPLPATCASLAYFDSYRSERLPANLTQAQRDYFGAHTYRRVDREGTFHTQWELPVV